MVLFLFKIKQYSPPPLFSGEREICPMTVGGKTRKRRLYRTGKKRKDNGELKSNG
jgi:hypothetical protein